MVKVCWEEEEVEEEEEIRNYNFSKVVSGSAELVPRLALSAFVTNIPHPQQPQKPDGELSRQL